MAKYDFLDPNQSQEFREKALTAGKSPQSIEAYIRTERKRQLDEQKLGLDIQKQQVSQLKLQKDILELQGEGSNALGDLSDFEKKIVNARIAGQEALGFLQEGLNTGPIATRLGQVGELVGRTGKGTEYRSALSLAGAQLFNALAGTTQSPAELKRLEKLVPKDTDQETVAQQKLTTLMRMLDTQAQAYGIDLQGALGTQESSQTPGMDIGTAPQAGLDVVEEPAPPVNVKGEIATPGDLMFDEKTGEMSIYGSPENKASLFKKTKAGGDIDTSLISFLAESEFLPISGSILGALSGAGVGSVATGAAGAALGKATQQGIREMLDPERQDMSDMATAVLIEGTADALIGGVTFGIGLGAGKGIRMVLGETGKEVADEALEQGVKKGLKSQIKESILYKELRPGKSLRTSFRNAFGKRFESTLPEETVKLIDNAIKSGEVNNLDEAIDWLAESRKTDIKNLKSMLAGETASKKEVLDSLRKIKGTAFVNDVPKADYSAGISRLDDFIKEIEALKSSRVSASKLNDIKLRMGDIAFSTKGEVLGASKELIADSERYLRKFIEQYDDRIAGTNKDIFLKQQISELGMEALDKRQFQLIGGFGDMLFGGASIISGNPVPFLLKKGVDIFKNNFDAVQQVKLLENMLQLSVATGDFTKVRNTLRFASEAGINFSAYSGALTRATRGAVSGAGASAVTTQMEPGLDIGPSQEEIMNTPLYK